MIEEATAHETESHDHLLLKMMSDEKVYGIITGKTHLKPL